VLAEVLSPAVVEIKKEKILLSIITIIDISISILSILVLVQVNFGQSSR
jgi:hypothetical protein